MKSFSEFDIQTTQGQFAGEQINIKKILNVPIAVNHFRIVPSTAKPGTNRLDLDITLNDVRRLVWTGSKKMMEQIVKIPEDGWPFSTTIKEENGYKFT